MNRGSYLHKPLVKFLHQKKKKKKKKKKSKNQKKKKSTTTNKQTKKQKKNSLNIDGFRQNYSGDF